MSTPNRARKGTTGKTKGPDAKALRQLREVMLALESVHGRARYVPRFDPLEELVSCILSQHSSDAASFPTFTRLRTRYPDWAELASTDPATLADVIRKAGLANQKAKAILGALAAIRETMGDYTLEPLRHWSTEDAENWLLSLPGVGPKTAAIVLCFALGRHAVPVDTHVSRVSQRLGLIPAGTDDKTAHQLLKRMVPVGDAFRFHLALIQHGRKICRAKKPLCVQCPVSHLCPTAREVAS